MVIAPDQKACLCGERDGSRRHHVRIRLPPRGMKEVDMVSDAAGRFQRTKQPAREIEMDPRGRFVYASNRGHNSIAVFAVDGKDGEADSDPESMRARGYSAWIHSSILRGIGWWRGIQGEPAIARIVQGGSAGPGSLRLPGISLGWGLRLRLYFEVGPRAYGGCGH